MINVVDNMLVINLTALAMFLKLNLPLLVALVGVMAVAYFHVRQPK